MKEKKICYLYHNQEFIGKFNSIREAVNESHETPQTAQNILHGKSKCSRRGYFYSFRELNQSEVMELPIKIKEKVNEIGRQKLEVQCKNMKVFALGRSKKARINQLKTFIYTKLHTRWLTIPQKQANLERIFVKEILQSLIVSIHLFLML